MVKIANTVSFLEDWRGISYTLGAILREGNGE